MIRATDSCQRDFYELVDHCLDGRHDPLDEPAVVAFLTAHPEHLEAFVGEREALRELVPEDPLRTPRRDRLHPLTGAVSQAAKPTKRTVTRTELLSAVAVAAAAGVALSFVLSNPRLSSPRQAPAVRAPAVRAPAVRALAGQELASQRPPRILSATLQEDAPMLNAAASYTVHDHLVRTNSVLFEAYERRSQRR